jgi:histidyl-tRNA synthetase
MSKFLSTDPYKGTRDFYPEDMAIERYIFDTWAKTAESFGYERYDASILEPSELYKSKGAENEEMVNEQTYTFIDRGDREVTLRPEMTPTVARMVAAKRRELSFPVRWYSIPNLFRYERPQRGRLREHWQLNCDMFGVDDVSADIEMIQLAYTLLTDFGATPDMFSIHVNSRVLMNTWYTKTLALTPENARAMTRLVDRRNKVSAEDFKTLLGEIVSDPDTVITGLDAESPTALGESSLDALITGLEALGITNVRFDASIARGFDYYTGVVFEIFDTSPENNRSMIGGGRYDNLTELFTEEHVSGIGFGMGDVIMRDFLETHSLLPADVRVTAPTLTIIPMDADKNLNALTIADTFRKNGVRVATDISDRKLGKKIGAASEAGVSYILVVGADEIASGKFTLKNLSDSTEHTGTITDLLNIIS